MNVFEKLAITGGSQPHVDQFSGASILLTNTASFPPRLDYRSVCSDGDYLYFSGGPVNTCGLWRYNTVNNTWLTLASVTSQRYFHAMACVAGNVYIYGSLNITGLSDLLVYNIATNTWKQIVTPTTKPPQHGFEVSFVVWGGDLFLVPTYNRPGARELWKYNIAANLWTKLTSTPKVSNPYTSITCVNGVIYTCSGVDIYAYNIKDNSWRVFNIANGVSVMYSVAGSLYASNNTILFRILNDKSIAINKAPFSPVLSEPRASTMTTKGIFSLQSNGLVRIT